MIRLLQLSDIHFHSFSSEEDDYTEIRDGVIDDIVALNMDHYDGIIICGDIAFSGSEQEYNKARSFIDELLEKIGCAPEMVFMVPGNHDKNGACANKYCREAVYKSLRESGQVDKDFAEIKDDLSKDGLDLLYRPYEQYILFASTYSSASKALENIISDNKKPDYESKYYWICPLAKIGNYDIQLVGIDSSLVSIIEDAKWNLKQILPNVFYRTHTYNSEIRISIMHHPLYNLVNENKVTEEMDKRFIVQLYGHEHAQKTESGSVLRFHSGALQPDGSLDSKYRPVYNIIELDVVSQDAKQDALSVNLKSRVWNGDSFEEYTQESKENMKIALGKPSQQRTDTIDSATMDVNKRKMKIQFTTLDSVTRRNIIEEHSDLYHYDRNINEMMNTVRFLNVLEAKNKFDILEEILNQHE